jgi:hypothetical protein
MTEDTTIDGLAARARDIARAGSAAAVFKALLEASRAVAPRAAVFVVRPEEIQGWGSFGYPGPVAQAQRAHADPRDAAWVDQLARAWDVPVAAAGGGPDFGQPPADQWTGCALTINGRPIALVVAERSVGETPWNPAGLALLAGLAEQRIELDLARRRVAGMARPAAESAPPGPAAEAPSRPAAESAGQAVPEDPAPPLEAPLPSSPAPTPAPTSDASRELERARRYAKLVATDIRLYNEEAVMAGRRNGDLAQRLSDHLDRGRETFARRHGDLGPSGLELLHEAYVQVLAGGNAALLPRS